MKPDSRTENSPFNIRGGCHCGAVNFEANISPKFIARCHCDSCRRTTGGEFSTWIGFPAGNIS